jgi:glycosyltransferase involved in cell wall biosynthesis
MSEKIRVLQVNIENEGGNGAFSLVRYLYYFLKEDFIFDFFTMSKFMDDAVYRDIVNDGGKCFSANLRSNKLLGHIKLPFVFYKYLKKNKYKIVHIHSEVAYKHFLYAIAARCAKVDKIIIHSHSSNIDGNNKGVKLVCHKILKSWVNRLGTYFLACSIPAAEWMFDDKVRSSNRFKLLHNGIDPRKYKFSEEKRIVARNKLGVENKIVIGHVGALKWVKNQQYLLEILSNIHDETFVLILIGDGEDKEKLVKDSIRLGVEKQVLFLGSRTDVAELLHAIDVFVFPSFFEGIPMAMIEAQTVGIPIVASDVINRDIMVNENISFISINDDSSVWIREIQKIKSMHLKEKGYASIYNSKYNIKNSAKILRAVYLDV